MTITSPAFKNGERIPSKYTCDGDDVNPELRLASVPAATKSLALIVDDPEATGGSWLHWSVWNMSPDIRVIEEDSVPRGARQGETDFSEVGYGGPCPGSGEHGYRFVMYALDTYLEVPHGAPRHVIEEAMRGHILSEASLTTRYQRVKKEPRKARVRELVAA